ncbi:hypothetical protein KP509_39G041400 [Ceratopteris richardii]|uniref:RING-CH-type domain-containing protein n=1 Tax=Ceratopteris richardii TaxID=49495 RepID=A0A8T2Q0U1_CERRI|nr:hypothetical protein KP509_39G041400 [Ceratopteris richardii]KAH7277234.1 hypothetical protein KP509_39G041400 [Ceratopteris richardii]KAH7277235.1 hypothetical protein KP509_39G041400 [Ceratopteris richardii]KAH7277236.1 hypothetical protein KP509_39G041400 [Ceratopteris richardii]
MSDHVAPSTDRLPRSDRYAGADEGDQAPQSVLPPLNPSEVLHTSTVETIAGGSTGLIVQNSKRIEAKDSNSVGSNRALDSEYNTRGADGESVQDSVNEESIPLLKAKNDNADRDHVVISVEAGLHSAKKDVESPAIAECRICQEEDDVANLESPCICSGSLKFAHRKCIQHWCNEKGDTVCEICQKPFEGGYATPPHGRADSITVDFGASWDIANGEPRLIALTTNHHFLEGDYDEYAGSHANSAACFRSVVLILVALLLLRHILSMTVGEDEDLTTFFMLSFIRAVGFLIPCYIMVRAMHALQIRRQQEEAAMAAAAEVSQLMQAGRIHAIVAAEP